MNASGFYIKLLLLTLFAVSSSFALDFFFPHFALLNFSLICITFFVVFTVLAFRLHLMAVKSDDKTLFSRIFMVSIFLKLMGCILLVIGHILINKPETYHFVLPFFLIYIVYTIFETLYISRLAKK